MWARLCAACLWPSGAWLCACVPVFICTRHDEEEGQAPQQGSAHAPAVPGGGPRRQMRGGEWLGRALRGLLARHLMRRVLLASAVKIFFQVDIPEPLAPAKLWDAAGDIVRRLHGEPAQAVWQSGTHLGMGVPTMIESLTTWRTKSVPNVWGPEQSMWACCMEGCILQAPGAVEQLAPTASCAQTQPGTPHTGGATLRTADGPAAAHGTGPRRPKGGVPSPAVLHTGGISCLVTCHDETTGVPRQSSWGCCPCGAPICGAASHRQNSREEGHLLACSWPPTEPHIRPVPEWRPAPATSCTTPWGRADTSPGRPLGGGKRKGGGGARSSPHQADFASRHPPGH